MNAPRLVVELRKYLPGATILVIDDSSPDGTGDLIAALVDSDPLLRLQRRPRKLGLGTAYLAAFAEGRRSGARVILTMDADWSHRPQDTPAVIRAVKDAAADLAIGSRYVPGGTVVGWPRGRRLLSAVANRLIKWSLRTTVTDCTGAFRAYRVELVELIGSDLRNTGYSALPELLMLAAGAGARIVEVPITFVEREQGATKLTRRELAKSVLNLFWLRRQRILRARRLFASAPTAEVAGRAVPSPTSPAGATSHRDGDDSSPLPVAAPVVQARD